MRFISCQMAHTTGDPLTPPDGQQVHYLRHYEKSVRSCWTMVTAAPLWITRLARPDGTINPLTIYLFLKRWPMAVTDACPTETQLYLGIAVLDVLQPGSNPLPVCEIHDTASSSPTKQPTKITSSTTTRSN
jgi:hypothetical protein